MRTVATWLQRKVEKHLILEHFQNDVYLFIYLFTYFFYSGKRGIGENWWICSVVHSTECGRLFDTNSSHLICEGFGKKSHTASNISLCRLYSFTTFCSKILRIYRMVGLMMCAGCTIPSTITASPFALMISV